MLTQYRLLDPWSKLTYEPLSDPAPFNRGGGPDRLAGSAGALPSLVDAPLRVPARPWLPASLGMNRALQTMAGESTSKTESRTSP